MRLFPIFQSYGQVAVKAAGPSHTSTVASLQDKHASWRGTAKVVFHVRKTKPGEGKSFSRLHKILEGELRSDIKGPKCQARLPCELWTWTWTVHSHRQWDFGLCTERTGTKVQRQRRMWQSWQKEKVRVARRYVAEDRGRSTELTI